jgi:hypothetical protein
MNVPPPKAAHPKPGNSPATLLFELEMQRTPTYEAFVEQLEAQLAELETRFSDFVTCNSFAGSIGR